MTTESRQRERAMEPIYRAIDRARVAWRLVAAADGALRLILICGGGLVAGFAADNLLHLPQAVRVGYLALLAAGFLFIAVRHLLYPLLRPINDEMVAAHVERAMPELDNRLINAVLFSHERFANPLTGRLAVSQIREAAGSVRTRDLARPVDLAALRRWGGRALLVVGAALAYVLLFGDHFSNAALRFFQPHRYVPPITDTRLEVSPGDTHVLQGDSIEVEARLRGILPEKALVRVRTEAGERSSYGMAFRGNAFEHRFPNVQQSFTYRVEGGDALTPPYRVTVRERPHVESLDLTYRYPEYTGLPERTEAGVAGDVRAPVGTVVRLEVRTDVPVRDGSIEATWFDAGGAEAGAERLPLVAEGPRRLRGELPVERSGRYAITVEDEEDVANAPAAHHVEAMPDAAPRVFFTEPGRDVAVAPGDRVALMAEAEDDYSLRALHLVVQRKAGAEWQKVDTWSYEAGTRTVREGRVLDTAELSLGVGDSVAYAMRATDGLRRDEADVGRSRVYRIRVVEPRLVGGADEETRRALRDVIRGLIELQQGNLRSTRDLARSLGAEPDAFADRADGLVAAEQEIYRRAVAAADEHGQDGEATLTEALRRIATDHVSRAIDLLKELRSAAPEPAAADELAERSEPAADEQARIVSLLEGLLENPAEALRRILAEGRAAPQEETVRPEPSPEARQLAEKLKRALEQFAEEQGRVVEMSKQLAEKPVDDFTDADEKKLKEIADIEKKWAEFFQEAATDLSKLPPQDFALAAQADEFLEVYSEVQQAAEDAQPETIELAVPREQAGLELAESIETNLEKWLMETKDHKLWSMEEPLEDYELPMTELPDELQDLIGELVEDEEEMTEEIEDITSGWVDSLDIGAGWGTEDGPISNMSAKGVTGNRMPNTNEVGGRSGEGRTGKSSGQFVEKTATGKGGRRTPTRLTPDPYESGWVDDTSGEAPSGATGGGKVSGQGAEGLRGPVPPPLQQRLRRVAFKQQELIDRARRLDYGLRKYRAPRGRLPDTIELMRAQQQALLRAQQQALLRGEISNFAASQRVVLSNMREVKELTEKQKQVMRDRSAALPKKVREEIASARHEPVPDRYREMVRNYFRALSEQR